MNKPTLKGSVIPHFGNDIESMPYYFEHVKNTTASSLNCSFCANVNGKQVLSCSKGCGSVYCCVECQSNDIKYKGHWVACSCKGRENRLTSDFLHHASLHNDHFRAVFKIISKIIALGINFYTKNKNLLTSMKRAIKDFCKLFPLNLDTIPVDEDSESYADAAESYALLIALLKYEKNFSTTQLDNIVSCSSEVWLLALEEITFYLFRHILYVVETSLIPIKYVSPLPPLLEELKNIPLLPKYSDRLQAVTTHNTLAEATTSFLIPKSNKQITLSEGFIIDTTVDDKLKVERAAARLAQAADLAATSDTSDNPLTGHVLSAMALIPCVYAVPANCPNDESLNKRFKHSCVPNVHLEAVWDEVGDYKFVMIRGIALRNIPPIGEHRSHCYIDSNANIKTRHADLNTKFGNDSNVIPCNCPKCEYDSNRTYGMNSLLKPFLTRKGYRNVQEGVDKYEDLYNTLSISNSRLMSVCSSTLSQYLLLELLSLCDGELQYDKLKFNGETYRSLNKALTIADVLMQESKTEQALILYCSIMLSFYFYNEQPIGSPKHDDSTEYVIQLVGDVLLSIGNILLDISMQPTASQDLSFPVDSSNSLNPDVKAIVEMFESVPYQLCHKLWSSGLILLKNNQHSGVNTHISDLKNYSFTKNIGDLTTKVVIDRSNICDVSNVNNYHQVTIENKGSIIKGASAPSIYLSKQAILSSDDCKYVIEVAEKHAADHMKGSWTTSRHYAVPTTDIPVQEVPLLLQWFNEIMREVLEPMLISQFIESNNTNLSGGKVVAVHDAFIVKYQSDEEGNIPSSKQRYLPLHSDQSTHSLTIALNAANEYTGGGTYFADLDASLRPDCGQVLSFKGELLHGGDPVTSGTRYILAIFLLLKTEQPSVTLKDVTEIRKRKSEDEYDDSASKSLAKMFKSRVASDEVMSVQDGIGKGSEDSGSFSFSFL